MAGPPTGARLTDKMAEVLTRVLTQHKAASYGLDSTRSIETMKAGLEQMESELAPHVAGIAEEMLANPALPAHMRPIVEQLLMPQNQTGFFEILITIFYLLQPLVMAVAAPWLNSVEQFAWRANPSKSLSPDAAAAAVVKGIMSAAEGEAEARDTGLEPHRFGQMVAAIGNPPSPGDLMSLYRRNVIDEARLEQGIRRGNTANEWIPEIKALRHHPLTSSQAVQAAVQGALGIEPARQASAEDGLRPDLFDVLYAVAGNPPGISDLTELLNRGDITEARFREAIAQSAYKNEWADEIVKLRHRIPPMERNIAMARAGLITVEDCALRLEKLGYFPEDARLMAESARHEKLAPEKDLAKAEIKALYLDHVIDRATAHGFIEELGYDVNEAEMILDLVDAERVRRLRVATVNKIHAYYVGHKIDRTQASQQLDAIGTITAERDEAMALWDEEERANVRLLTVTELYKAWVNDLIDLDGYRGRLRALGYTDDDVEIILKLKGAVPTPGEPE